MGSLKGEVSLVFSIGNKATPSRKSLEGVAGETSGITTRLLGHHRLGVIDASDLNVASRLRRNRSEVRAGSDEQAFTTCLV